jgi:hypothetical protein
MKLSEYLQTLQPDERLRFSEIIARLESMSEGWVRFCSNLQDEGQLNEESWRFFGVYIMAAPDVDLAYQTTLHIRKHYRQYQLQGNRDPDGETECLARLVSLAAFADLVVEQDTDGMLPLQVIAYLRSEVVDKEIDTLPLWFLKLRLGLYLIWAAIGLGAPNDRTSARLAACRCGLPQEIEIGPIICLRYRLPPGVHAHAPTVFDAYGGWPWPAFFKAGVWVGTRYAGSTEPRTDCSGEAGFREVVSASVPLSCLCEAIKLVE